MNRKESGWSSNLGSNEGDEDGFVVLDPTAVEHDLAEGSTRHLGTRPELGFSCAIGELDHLNRQLGIQRIHQLAEDVSRAATVHSVHFQHRIDVVGQQMASALIDPFGRVVADDSAARSGLGALAVKNNGRELRTIAFPGVASDFQLAGVLGDPKMVARPAPEAVIDNLYLRRVFWAIASGDSPPLLRS